MVVIHLFYSTTPYWLQQYKTIIPMIFCIKIKDKYFFYTRINILELYISRIFLFFIKMSMEL